MLPGNQLGRLAAAACRHAQASNRGHACASWCSGRQHAAAGELAALGVNESSMGVWGLSGTAGWDGARWCLVVHGRSLRTDGAAAAGYGVMLCQPPERWDLVAHLLVAPVVHPLLGLLSIGLQVEWRTKKSWVCEGAESLHRGCCCCRQFRPTPLASELVEFRTHNLLLYGDPTNTADTPGADAQRGTTRVARELTCTRTVLRRVLRVGTAALETAEKRVSCIVADLLQMGEEWRAVTRTRPGRWMDLLL